MRGWTGHNQGNLAPRVCEPPCGECAVQRQILSPGTAKLRRVLRTKQPKRSRGSGLPFASPLRRAQQKQGTATTRGKEFLSRVCGQKWVPPGACRKSDTLKKPPRFTPQGFRLREAGIYLFSQAVSSQLSSAQVSLTSVFGMGTGGTSPSLTPANALTVIRCFSFGGDVPSKLNIELLGKQSTNFLRWGQALDLLVHPCSTPHDAYT